jgi:hypothetical protein
VQKLRHVPLGAILGVSVGGGIEMFAPETLPGDLHDWSFYLVWICCGVTLERTVHWLYGWWLDPYLYHQKATREARIQLRILKDYVERGFVPEEVAKKKRQGIALVDVAGHPPPRRRRMTPYTRRPKPGAGVTEPADPGRRPQVPTPESPAAAEPAEPSDSKGKRAA